MNIQIDSLDEIKKLGELKELGLVTEEEFQEKKSLIFLQEKQEILAATQDIAGVSDVTRNLREVDKGKRATTQVYVHSSNESKKKGEGSIKEAATITNEARNRNKSRKRREVENKEATKKPSALKNSYKQKKRRKIKTLEGTTAPASNPDGQKKGYSSALLVGLGILVLLCLGAVALYAFL